MTNLKTLFDASQLTSEQVTVGFGGSRLDHHHAVLHQFSQVRGNLSNGAIDQLFEQFVTHRHRHEATLDRASEAVMT